MDASDLSRQPGEFTAARWIWLVNSGSNESVRVDGADSRPLFVTSVWSRVTSDGAPVTPPEKAADDRQLLVPGRGIASGGCNL